MYILTVITNALLLCTATVLPTNLVRERTYLAWNPTEKKDSAIVTVNNGDR